MSLFGSEQCKEGLCGSCFYREMSCMAEKWSTVYNGNVYFWTELEQEKERNHSLHLYINYFYIIN